MPQRRQQEGGGGGVDGATLVAHPAERVSTAPVIQAFAVTCSTEGVRASHFTLPFQQFAHKGCTGCAVYFYLYLFSQRDVWIFQLSKKLLKLVENWRQRKRKPGKKKAVTLRLRTTLRHRKSQNLFVEQRKTNVHLDVQNSKVGYQVPARGAVFVVPVESKSCCVVDGISCRWDFIKAFEQHNNRGGGASLP